MGQRHPRQENLFLVWNYEGDGPSPLRNQRGRTEGISSLREETSTSTVSSFPAPQMSIHSFNPTSEHVWTHVCVCMLGGSRERGWGWDCSRLYGNQTCLGAGLVNWWDGRTYVDTREGWGVSWERRKTWAQKADLERSLEKVRDASWICLKRKSLEAFVVSAIS